MFNLSLRIRDEYQLKCQQTAKDTLKEFGRCFWQLEHNGDMVGCLMTQMVQCLKDMVKLVSIELQGGPDSQTGVMGKSTSRGAVHHNTDGANTEVEVEEDI